MNVTGREKSSAGESRPTPPTLSLAEAFFDALFRMSAIAVIGAAAAFLAFDIAMVDTQVMFVGIGTIIAVTMAYVPFETLRSRRLEYPISDLGAVQRVRWNLLFATSMIVAAIMAVRFAIGSRYLGKETIGLVVVMAALAIYAFLQSRRHPAKYVAAEMSRAVKRALLIQFGLIFGWGCALWVIFSFAESEWQFALFVSVTVAYYLAKRQTRRLLPKTAPSSVNAQEEAGDGIAERRVLPIE